MLNSSYQYNFKFSKAKRIKELVFSTIVPLQRHATVVHILTSVQCGAITSNEGGGGGGGGVDSSGYDERNTTITNTARNGTMVERT